LGSIPIHIEEEESYGANSKGMIEPLFVAVEPSVFGSVALL
jgi:hypothetical protein